MKYSIKILKKELKDWKEQYASDKHYYKGYYDDKEAIRAFKSDKKHIAELEKAIEVLKISSKVHVSGSLPKKDFKVRGTITYDMKKGTSKYKAKRQ